MKNQNQIITAQELDLTNCGREAIHIPGSIQPHGVLFVLEEPQLKILQVSNNTFSFFGLQPEQLLNQNLDLLIDKSQIENIKNRLKSDKLKAVDLFRVTVSTGNVFKDLVFDAVVHRSNGGVILELEPVTSQGEFAFLNFYHLVRPAVVNIQKSTNFQDMCQVIAREVRSNTGFDRTMVYKFDSEGNGEIIAEDRRHDLESWLGLHYPASDIPKPARKLYLLNWIRLIVDINYQPVEIVPARTINNEPLDMSLSVLRSVSPIHIEYLQNMGVCASLCISLIKDQKLWGMIVCHHQSPKYVSYEARAACEFLGQVMSLELPFKEDNEDYDYRMEIKAIQSRILEQMSAEENFIDGLVKYYPNLLDLANAQGAVVCIGDSFSTVGKTPQGEDLDRLIKWVDTKLKEEVFYTDSLIRFYRKAEKIKDVASGLLAISISKVQKIYVLWFRPEVIQTVHWAGDPNRPIEIQNDGSLRLHPRKSFALWKETVKFKSLPWKPCEIEAATELKSAIIKVVLRQAEELKKLNAALQESETREREKANQLEIALQELQEAQTQLVQNEKMASLGQLVAGVAHEINNPINFIYGNLAHADHYVKDLLNILNIYSQYYPDPVAEIKEKSREIDLTFLRDDLPKILRSMKMGTERIREIVQSLRNFSRLDEAEMKRVDIHEGLDSTLLILNNRLKAGPSQPAIQVIKEYGQLPLVECYAGQLNQVFMNLLANAIDAIEDSYIINQKSLNEPGKIKICTELLGDNWVKVRIADNGPGIPKNVQLKLFDPFFTTKPVGKGTGIGLAISYQIIVEKHGGHLTCTSVPGQGAEFIIEIPLTLPQFKS